MTENRCVCCGRIIPEGKQVCRVCWVYDEPGAAKTLDRMDKLLVDYGFDNEEGLRFALDQYRKLISELTHGVFSKLNYYAETILDVMHDQEDY